MLGLLIVRTVVFYFVLLVLLRVMGKREVGSLTPFDLVITILIAELVAVPIENPDLPIIDAVVPLLTLVALEVLFSRISLRSPRLRKFMSGRPKVIIRDGHIMETEMRRERYNLEDLLEQLRLQGTPDVADVEVAILEVNGSLSVIPKSQRRAVTPADLGIETSFEGLPTTLIWDGQPDYGNLKQAGLDLSGLEERLRERGIDRVQDVLFAGLDTDGNLFVQPLELPRRRRR